MKRILTSTTALSVALASIGPLPLFAQTTLEVDGAQVMCFAKAGKECPDGATCFVIPEGPCTKAAVKAAKAANSAAEPADDAAAAEAKAARKAAKAAEAAAAEEAKAAEEKAARKAAKAAEEAAAPADDAADDAAAAEAKAARKAAKAAEAAAAEEAQAAEAKAARKAAKAAEDAAADDAAAAEAKAARKAAKAAEAAAAEDAAADDAAAAEAKAARKAAKAAEAAAADDAAAEEAAAAEAKAARKAAKAAKAAAAEDAANPKPAAGADEKPRRKKPAKPLPLVQSAEGVKAPSAEAVDTLSDILTEPAKDTDAEASSAPKASSGETAPAEKPRKKPRKPKAADAIATDPAKDAVVTVVDKDDTRTSDQDFATAAVTSDAEAAQADKKRSKMSDLEKFGLVVLGGLVVGALLKNGDEVVSNTGDRVVVQRDDGTMTLLKDDDTLIRQPGSTVSTESYDDGSTRTIVERADGTKIMTIRDASGRVLRRARINLDGSQTLLIDDLTPVQEVNVSTLPKPRNLVISTAGNNADLQAALLAEQSQSLGRSFSLRQIRDYREVRALAPMVDVESVTFASGSAAIAPTEARKLAALGRLMSELIADNPSEMFLIEGHTDAVGGAAYNLALSDRRAESLALALTEYFDVPAENMVIEGYGEAELRIATQTDEALNRRAVVRLISPLLSTLSAKAN